MSDMLVSDEILTVCKWVIYGVLCLLINIFGIITNVMNIICFTKLGFIDPVNISLLGLAVADMCSLVTLSYTNIWFTPVFNASKLAFEAVEVLYLVGSVPHTTFTRVCAWITAVITLERCLCITVPLKPVIFMAIFLQVKSIITSRRVAVLIICIYTLMMVTIVPFYSVNNLGMKYFSLRNKTLLGLVLQSYSEEINVISIILNNIFFTFSAFFVIVVCTIILAIQLRKATSWQAKYTNASQTDHHSNRNQKVAKMIVLVSSLFIDCFIPVSLLFLGALFEPEFYINGKYKRIAIIAAGVSFIFESINSSGNIFIYYRMSGKYKAMLLSTFCCHKTVY